MNEVLFLVAIVTCLLFLLAVISLVEAIKAIDFKK